MLVLEPSKRYCVTQIKRHRWMQVDIPPSIPATTAGSNTQPNEQILRLMQSLGIDGSKTREVSQLVNMLFFSKALEVIFLQILHLLYL